MCFNVVSQVVVFVVLLSMAQQPQSLSQIYKQFTDTFSPTENPRDVVRFAKRRLSVQLKYRDVKKFLSDKSIFFFVYILYFSLFFKFINNQN